jgi:hypothetical protein
MEISLSRIRVSFGLIPLDIRDSGGSCSGLRKIAFVLSDRRREPAPRTGIKVHPLPEPHRPPATGRPVKGVIG